jgi:riboflavin biosynthesis pyrimidine reductase
MADGTRLPQRMQRKNRARIVADARARLSDTELRLMDEPA